jgi:hypothetical protein
MNSLQYRCMRKEAAVARGCTILFDGWRRLEDTLKLFVFPFYTKEHPGL